MSLNLIVEISREASNILRKTQVNTTDTKKLLDIVNSFGLTIKPLHEEDDDPLTYSLFYIETPEEIAEQVRDSILNHDLVLTAYLKAKAETPNK